MIKTLRFKPSRQSTEAESDLRFSNYRLRKQLLPYYYIAPITILLVLISLFPLVYNLYRSFYKFSLMDPFGTKFIGIANYVKIILGDEFFWNSVWNTLYFSVGAVSLELLLGMILALLLNRKNTGGRGVYRTLMMLPIIMTPIAVAYMWRVIYTPDMGIMNYLLSLIGIEGPEWTADIYWAMPSLIIVDVWQWIPFMALIFLSGLMSLPQEPFDAAKIDGASAWQSFWFITIPLLKPIILIALLIRVIDSFKLFDLVYAMTQGGPLRHTETFNFYIYQTAFRYLDVGYASALSITLLLMIILLSIAFIKVGGIDDRT